MNNRTYSHLEGGEQILELGGDGQMEHSAYQHRIERLEEDVRGLLKTDRKHTEDITHLKESQAEVRAFQKFIMDQLAEIKAMISSGRGQSGSSNKEWLDFVKWVIGITFGAIIAWMVKGNL